MQFSDTSNLQGIVEDITFLLGNIDTNQYVLKDRARNVNERYRTVWSWIFEAYGGWHFVDDNTSDTSTFPYGDVSLTSGTKAYGLPSGSLTVINVEVEDSNGVARVLTPLTYEEVQKVQAVTEFMTTNSIPQYYVLSGDVIELYPTPNYTRSSAMRVYFDRDISTFASTDTTKTPGFAAPFHRALSVGGALDFALSNSMNEKVVVLTGMWQDYEKRIKEFYSQRFKARFPSRIRVRDAYKEYA